MANSIKIENFESSNVKQEGDTFTYENETLPLKGNTDYVKLMQHLLTLTALRTQALLDIDKVVEVQDEALNDPLEFIRKLQNGEDIGVPHRLTVPEMPVVDWSKYRVQPGAFRLTRPKSRETKSATQHDGRVVRGRVKDETKPATFNQLWTAEEQLRLEELLIKYPPELNEARRFKKIAQELGNRTLSQVTSRCQKYFAKLHKNGLPVPGRTPRRRDLLKNPKHKTMLKSQSTFFPRSLPPIELKDDGDLPGTSSVGLFRIKSEPIDSDDGYIPEENLRQMLHQRVRLDLSQFGNDPVKHHGFTCNVCRETPLKGTRWHCLKCDQVDFCSKCLIIQLEDPDAEPHPLGHPLASYRPVSGGPGDTDYGVEPGEYNYLDPNFRPE